VFWVGMGLAVGGFIGNVVHDEILFAIRRNAKAKGKGKADSKNTNEDTANANATPKLKEHYAIPHGGLYSIVSFPNYFCEWVEWFGFALAAGPIPDFALLPAAKALLAAATGARFTEMGHLFSPFVDTVTPPWVFLFVEIAVMAPRAIRGHRWYHERFRGSYPRERRAVIPWLL